ncbi:MAG: hypothetical protein ABI128_08530 [Rhodanobacter sp.]
MRRLQRVAVIGFVLAAPAWAQEPSAIAPPRGGTLAAPALPADQQHVKRDQAEIMRLQREVARQESDSQRASQRLQRQDQQIAELQRKLSKLRVSPGAGHP